MSKKFTKPEFLTLLEDLDVSLRRHGIKLKAICCGGFVMQMRYASPRQTGDIDTVSHLPDEVQHLASEAGRARISDEHEFQQVDWINDTTALWRLGEKLPEGWRHRAFDEEPIVNLPNVRLYPLSRDDMIFAKLYAVATGRATAAKTETDEEDLERLGLTVKDVERHEKAIVALFPLFKGLVAKWRLRSDRKSVV